MKDFIYLNEKGELVADNTPNATCYVRMDYVKVQWDAQDKSISYKQIIDEQGRKIDNLNEQVKVKDLIISKLENGQAVGHIDHDNQSVFEHSK